MNEKSHLTKKQKLVWLPSLLVLIALLLSACQGEIPATGATATAAVPPATMVPEATTTTELMPTEAAAMAEAELSVREDPAFGPILVGNDGLTLYMFTKDEPNTVNCAGECLVQWPPLITQGEPVLGEGVDPALVGTADLPDGQTIVTYNGMPLYYWIGDSQPGDVTGQNVGGVWFVVSPEGEVIEEAPSGSTGTEGASEGSMETVEAEINVVDDPELGEILVGNDGMTLYIFTKDEPNQSNCDDDCLAKWPPLVTQGEPVLGEGIDPGLVGTADLPDGRMIVTFNEMPLYYWVNDEQAGDTTGQGVGSVWYVLSPTGQVIGMESDGDGY